MGYEFWPEALERPAAYAAARARVPLYVTENGISTEDDTRRIEYIQRALAGVSNCLRDGIDVRGYIHWSLLDNFEWIFGLPSEVRPGCRRPSTRRSARRSRVPSSWAI